MDVKPGYKTTELGSLPEDWEVLPVRNALRGWRLGGNYSNGAGYMGKPLIKMGNIGRGRVDTSSFSRIHADVTPNPDDRLNHGDILFNTRNTLDLVGKVAMWREELQEAYYNSNLLRLDFDPKCVTSSSYANAVFNAPDMVQRLATIATGTTSVGAIYTGDLMRVLVALAPVAEQEDIGKILEIVESSVSSLRHLATKWRALKQGIRQVLLTGDLRLPGFNVSWNQKNVGDFAHCTSGGTPDTGNLTYWGGGIPWMNSGELNLRFIYEVEGRITPLGLASSSAKIVKENSVLIGLAGQGKTRGTVAINRIPLAINQSVAAILPNKEVASEFLFHNLDNRYVELRGMSTGGEGRGGLNLSIIRSIKIRMPNFEEQTAIANVLNDCEAVILALENRIDKMLLIQIAINHELLKGRIRLK